jgi:hypothetical protein
VVFCIAHFQKFDGVVQLRSFQWAQGLSIIRLGGFASIYLRRNDQQIGVLSRQGHPFPHLLTWRWPLPHYYFDIKDGHTLVDPSGLNFKTDDDAIARAQAIAIVVSIDRPEVDPKRHIAVLNGSREEIFRVPVYSKPSMSTT